MTWWGDSLVCCFWASEAFSGHRRIEHMPVATRGRNCPLRPQQLLLVCVIHGAAVLLIRRKYATERRKPQNGTAKRNWVQRQFWKSIKTRGDEKSNLELVKVNELAHFATHCFPTTNGPPYLLFRPSPICTPAMTSCSRWWPHGHETLQYGSNRFIWRSR